MSSKLYLILCEIATYIQSSFDVWEFNFLFPFLKKKKTARKKPTKKFVNFFQHFSHMQVKSSDTDVKNNFRTEKVCVRDFYD